MKSLSTALLILSCCIWLAMGAASSQLLTDIEEFSSVGTVRFKGTTLRVFHVDGAQVAEPAFEFQSSCSAFKFSWVYMKYQLALPLRIYANTLRSVRRSSKKIGRVTITGLKVKANKGLLSSQSELTVLVELRRSGRAADLLFLCSSFLRCRHLREEIVSNSKDIGRAMKFQAVGTVGHRPVRFGVRRSANSPRLSCNRHRWVVFQRRVDGSLSFAQNWDAYVKGFGNPKSNYWMGLDRLSAMTTTADVDDSRCQLRVETADFRGRKYSAEFGTFQVQGPEHNYRLRLAHQVGRSSLGDNFLGHNHREFSTFDRGNRVLCSQKFGYGGWWWSHCHGVCLNCAYTTNWRTRMPAHYNSAVIHGKWTVMARTLMKFRCH